MLCVPASDKNIHIFSTECLNYPETYEDIDVVVNGIGGIWGVAPSFAVLESGAKLITANKETFVTAGYLFMERAKELGKIVGVDVVPIDSEHSAVWQCLRGENFDDVESITLTASGGALRDLSKEEISNIKANFALNHPTWKMGKKVTIDSATLMNKGFEIIEAKHLFSCENINVVIHKESIIHSMVTFKDGCSKLQFSVPDMRLPIEYAITYPERGDMCCDRLSLADVGTLTFARPDKETFRCLQLCIDAINAGGLKPAAANGANEMAVELFLKGKISFLQIGEFV